MKRFNLFRAVFKKSYIHFKRYPFNTLSALVAIYLIFLLLFLGIKAFTAGKTMYGGAVEGLIVGFFIWTFAIFAYSDLSFSLLQEARQGTLEQLYMTPVGFGWVNTFSILSNFVISLLLNALVLSLMMLTTGRLLHMDLVSLLPLLFVTLSGVYGIGLMMGGLALVYKRVEASFQILQFIFVILIATPSDKFPPMVYLPLSLGTELVSRIMIDELSLLDIPLRELFFLTGNSIFYLALGYGVFKLCERKARKRGLLGHY